MIDLRVLGPIELRDRAGAPVESVLRQPKRLAVLAYLAAARPRGFHPRDTLLGLFWPESGEENARNALGQVLHGLRQALGQDAVVSRGTELGVPETELACDVTEFDRALDEGRYEDALRAYRGDLLDGFYLSGAPAFERWVETERERLRRAACDAAWRVARRAEGGGDVTTALRWARWAFALYPLSERGVVKLMDMLDRAGDRAMALQEYREFADRVESELGAAPSQTTRAAVDRIRER